MFGTIPEKTIDAGLDPCREPGFALGYGAHA